MMRNIARRVVATAAIAGMAIGGALTTTGPAFAAEHSATVTTAYAKAKPPCTRCCLKMNKKTKRCAKYGYHRGKGKCQAKCK